jgi:hypothetical protein
MSEKPIGYSFRLYVCRSVSTATVIPNRHHFSLHLPSSAVLLNSDLPQPSSATAPNVPGVSTLSLPFLIPRLFSIRSAGSPRVCLINANVMTPASTYFLPSNPLRPTLLISASASSAILCLASSTRKTGLFLGSGNAERGGACIMSPSMCCDSFGRCDWGWGSNCDRDVGE